MPNPDHELAPSLLELAGRWPLYPSTSIHIYGVMKEHGPERVEELVDVARCCLCHEEVYGCVEGLGHEVVGHLLLSHGYRMDGRQWNNQNELVGHA